MEKLICKYCGATELKKNGFVYGVQRYLCKKCQRQFTKLSPHGKEAKTKAMALALCQLGIAPNQTAQILSITPTTVLRWIKDFPKNIPYQFNAQGKTKSLDETTLRSYVRQLYIENMENFGLAQNTFANGYEVDVLIKNRRPKKNVNRKNIHVCCFGDSILQGIIHDEQTNQYKILKENFVHLVENQLNIQWHNFARHGLTVKEGLKTFLNHQDTVKNCDYVLLLFGGNESNYDWDTISISPHQKHSPKMSLNDFHEQYLTFIRWIQKKGKIPVLVSLPPVHAERFFENICIGRNRKNLLQMLHHNLNNINTWHSMYNLEIFKIAIEANIPIIDITTYFLSHLDYERYLCDDGVHPNANGHLLIANALQDFYKKYM